MTSDVRVPRLLTVKQLVAATGIPKWKIYDMLAQGTAPPHLRIQRTYYFAEDAVAKWIHEQSTTNAGGGR